MPHGDKTVLAGVTALQPSPRASPPPRLRGPGVAPTFPPPAACRTHARSSTPPPFYSPIWTLPTTPSSGPPQVLWALSQGWLFLAFTFSAHFSAVSCPSLALLTPWSAFPGTRHEIH